MYKYIIRSCALPVRTYIVYYIAPSDKQYKTIFIIKIFYDVKCYILFRHLLLSRSCEIKKKIIIIISRRVYFIRFRFVGNYIFCGVYMQCTRALKSEEKLNEQQCSHIISHKLVCKISGEYLCGVLLYVPGTIIRIQDIIILNKQTDVKYQYCK